MKKNTRIPDRFKDLLITPTPELVVEANAESQPDLRSPDEKSGLWIDDPKDRKSDSNGEA